MNKGLTQVQDEIEKLQYKLAVLYEKEKNLKRGNPPDLVGKYIYQNDYVFEMYMRVDNIEWDESIESYVAIGPVIDITTRKIGFHYNLSSKNRFNLSERYELSDKEAYNNALSRAVADF